jgi:hypothetical protein
MTRLPIPGADNGRWGDILNDFLSVEHNNDGTLRSSGTIDTKADKSYVDAAVAGVTVPVTSVNSQIGAVNLTASDVSADSLGAASAVAASSIAFILYNTGSSSYPARTSATADANRIVAWVGPVAPTIGGSGAVNDVDIWWKTP